MLSKESYNTLWKYSNNAETEAKQCNIQKSLFILGELVKKGQEDLGNIKSGDDFVKVNRINQSTISIITSALKDNCYIKTSNEM